MRNKITATHSERVRRKRTEPFEIHVAIPNTIKCDIDELASNVNDLHLHI